MAKKKLTKEQISSNDREESRKFLTIVALSALALMLLMYFIFVR
jgi:hypothetical protein